MVVLQHIPRQQILYAIRASQQSEVVPHPDPDSEAIPTEDKQFQILISKLGIDSKVVANVDPGNEKE
jgi:hypothetical protein